MGAGKDDAVGKVSEALVGCRMGGSAAAVLSGPKHATHTISSPESQTSSCKQTMSTKTLTTAVLGSSVPPFTPHAISVCLPTWKDNVGYEEGEKRVVDSMVTGYPRFFIHKSIKKVRDPPMLIRFPPFTQSAECYLITHCIFDLFLL